LWWFAVFFNFTEPVGFECCSLTQEMSFLDSYLPYFRQWLITCQLLAFLPFQSFVYWSSYGDQLLASPPSPVHFQSSRPLYCVLVFSFLFLVQFFFFFFFGRGVSLSRALCWFIIGVAWGILHDTWPSPVRSAECLPSRFGAGVWWWEAALLFS
jgi:hypothetical protein